MEPKKQSMFQSMINYIHGDNFINQIIWYITDSNYREAKDVSKFIKENMNQDIVKETVEKNHWKELANDDLKVISILIWVIRNITYKSDKINYKAAEHWSYVYETLSLYSGDCIANYEEIYTEFGIKKVGDLEVGEMILSYDFNNKKFVYKKVIKIWKKGELPIKRVHLRNGQHIDITDNHPLWCRINQKGKGIYKKTYLKDIDLNRWWKRRLPIAIRIPYQKSIPRFPIEIYRVIGHYIAEGWYEKKGKVQSSGYDLIENIIPILEYNNVPFSEYKNNSGVPCINFLSSELKEYLKGLKNNSFDINIYEEILTLPPEYLEEFLYGLWLGDGHKHPEKSRKEWIYSTSSEQLAKDIQRIGLQLGRTFHIWKQEHHKGVGTKPIWRITFTSQSHFLKNHGYKDISEVSISYIEDLGKTEMRDFEVEDTHTFVFKNGLISHQCEDGAILMYCLAREAGIPKEQLKICAGDVYAGTGKTGGHAWLRYTSLNFPTVHYFIDWCYYPDTGYIPNRTAYIDFKGTGIKPNDKYKTYWFLADEDNGYKIKSS